jgi:hypothetical protein
MKSQKTSHCAKSTIAWKKNKKKERLRNTSNEQKQQRIATRTLKQFRQLCFELSSHFL